MTIKIGGATHTTRRPRDLDAALIATTGINAAETAAMLQGSCPLPGRIAAALLPFLAEGENRPNVHELAVAIASDDLPRVLIDTRALYASADTPTPPADK